MDALISPLPKELTGSSPNIAPSATMRVPELIFKVGGNPIIEIHYKEAASILVRK
jgi:hypothetical protein